MAMASRVTEKETEARWLLYMPPLTDESTACLKGPGFVSRLMALWISDSTVHTGAGLLGHSDSWELSQSWKVPRLSSRNTFLQRADLTSFAAILNRVRVIHKVLVLAPSESQAESTRDGGKGRGFHLTSEQFK